MMLFCLLYVSLCLVDCIAATARFIVEPEDVTVSQGQIIMLKCAIQDAEGPVQWLRNGFGLGTDYALPGYPRYHVTNSSLSNEYNLMIGNVQLEDDGYFECQVGATEKSTGLKSRQAYVTVHLQPESVYIEGAPVIQTVFGKSHVIKCIATGSRPAVTIRWLSNGEEIKENIEYSTQLFVDLKRSNTTSELTIVPRLLDQGRRFICSVKNDALLNDQTTAVSLDVFYIREASIKVVPGSKVQEYNNVEMTCNAMGNPAVQTWKWFKSGELLNQTGKSLTFYRVARDLHGVVIVCEASNSVGSVRQNYTLNILYGPRFRKEPESVSGDVGGSVTLQCDVDSNPEATVVWRKMGSTRILSSESNLLLQPLALDSFTVYICTASVYGYNEISREVRLFKKDAPLIISSVEQSARYGETAEIECRVQSIPEPKHITWLKNGNLLDFQHLKRYAVREENIVNGKRSIVEISNVQDEDFNDYNCTVDNGYGTDSVIITFSRKRVIALAYIIAAVLTGVLIIIAVSIIIFICYRRKTSDSFSDTSSVESKPKILDDHVGSYSTNSVDTWQQDLVDFRDLDQTRYTPYTNYDDYYDNNWRDSYRTNYVRPTRNDVLYNRLDPVYGAPYQQPGYDEYGMVPPPASPTASRYSTNV